MSGKKSGSQAVVRALRLLKLFSDNTPQLSIAEVVQKTGLNRTTVFRLLSALQTEGFIDRLPSGSYSLGGESMALGSYALRHNALWQAAHPVLLDLSAEVNERVTLEIPSPAPNGAVSMLVVDEIAGSHRIGVRNFVGEHLPIHATSTGKAVLAFLPEMERDAIFDQQFESLTENTLVERGVISAEIAT
ncbi:MAG: IclR family transcriptional regulator, partial [Candidatus Promineifilaceae bacterium]